MKGKYLRFVGANNQYYFSLVAPNGEKLLRSEGYVTAAARDNGIESVRVNSPFDSRYDRRTSVNGQYYFNLKAANGQVIGTSEMYVSAQGRDNGIEAVKRYAPTADLA
ncbi:MAG: hypothetical protein RL204_423 [Bacteroidota bacterium]|jgi:uncharacterized protein YegP (UPF0339 family)